MFYTATEFVQKIHDHIDELDADCLKEIAELLFPGTVVTFNVENETFTVYNHEYMAGYYPKKDIRVASI